MFKKLKIKWNELTSSEKTAALVVAVVTILLIMIVLGVDGNAIDFTND